MLAAMLARLIPNLRAEGVEVKYLDRDPMRRVRILEIKASDVSNVSNASTEETDDPALTQTGTKSSLTQ